jgi:hypothetical protein
VTPVPNIGFAFRGSFLLPFAFSPKNNKNRRAVSHYGHQCSGTGQNDHQPEEDRSFDCRQDPSSPYVDNSIIRPA